MSPVVLSLAMIVRDEAALLPGVLADAATYCDELVVVDTGSSDETRVVAAGLGARVLSFVWGQDFSAARNYAFSCCRGDWITFLDADDRVPAPARRGFRRLKDELADAPGLDVVVAPYRYAFDRPDSDLCTLTFPRARVFRASASPRWRGRVHEFVPTPPGRASYRQDCWVEHRPPPERRLSRAERNLHLIERAFADGDRSTRLAMFQASELLTLGRADEAAAVHAALLEGQPSPAERYGALLELGRLAEAAGDEQRAQACFAEAAQLQPGWADAHLALGMGHYRRRAWAEAIPHLRAAAACEPPREYPYNEVFYSWFPADCLAICLGELGRFAEAIEWTLRAMPGNPDPDRLQANLAHYRRRLAERDPSA